MMMFCNKMDTFTIYNLYIHNIYLQTLHWLVKPKDSMSFHPNFIKFLEEGVKSGTSKKDAEVRVTELREAILPVLTKDLQENPEIWLSSKTTMLLVVAVLSIGKE